MSIQGFQQDSPLTYKNGDTGVIPANYLVTLTGTAGEVAVCGADGVPVGIADGDVGMGDNGSFKPMQGRVRVIASGTIAAGAICVADAGGLVAGDTGVSVNAIGQAETAGDTGAAFYMVCRG